ncbi:hypothetical protein MFLAVUS_010045 [Mucor flavus]|uniref:Uncharacterized protein n=1 Tax=Mucor flavus TaxID=439312 RepID=A0ABP9ZBQ4_9FUNG
MGSIPTPKRTDSKAQVSTMTKKKCITSNKEDTHPSATTSTSVPTPEMYYLHAQAPEWILGISSEIRDIQFTFKHVLERNQLLDKKVNSFSETELLLQQAKHELSLYYCALYVSDIIFLIGVVLIPTA